MTGEIRETLGWVEFGSAARELSTDVVRSGFVPDVVVAIARGGLLLAGAMAYAMKVKSCGALNVEFYTGVDARLPEPIMLAPHLDQESLADKRVLVVDDVSDSGRTLSMVVTLLERTGAEVRSVCLYTKPGTILEPDFAWKSTDRWIDFPWSVLDPVMA
ncbi:hypoxanthine phosphoribosyltransferase [Marisediminicola sp. UYEF4]|uniref:phosphoribosyltransferase n=1 Tax=Marisediminicola sp. UYEF4 TaxID=1756384 RepID=UPI0033948370